MTAYRILFTLAALYNAAFGIWAGFFPGHFFTLFNLEPPLYPSIWSCLGMVVGVYALAYAHVAWKPEQGDVLIAVGLLGKILGPIGWMVAIGHGELPPRTFPLILTNDLIWWFPFLLYLLRNHRARRAIITWVGVAIHVVACLLLMASSGGTEITEAFADRMRWIADNQHLWAVTWFCWTLASLSLLAFFVVWAGCLLELNAPRTWVILACLTCAVGLLCDLMGETINIVCLTQKSQTTENFAVRAEAYTLLGPGAANGLYCLAGLAMSIISWRIGWLRGWVGILGFAMWIVGLLLTVMAIWERGWGMIVTGGLVMLLFVPWAALVGWRMFDCSTRDHPAQNS